MNALPEAYNTLVERLKSLALMRSCGAVLGWDEQTYLPTQGAELRANQLALLAGLAHDQATSPEVGDLLARLGDEGELGGPGSIASANVREARRNYERSTRLSKKLVEEMTRVTTLAQQNWIEARKKNEFSRFQPWLKQIIALKREEADALQSPTGVRYDALLEDYEPGATVQQIQQVFAPLRDELVKLVAGILDSGIQADISILERQYPIEAQKQFSLEAARAIGFDFESGRLDIAAHPFCTGIGPGDCRLTTRYDEHHFPGAFFGTLHEAGHGLYEQGLRRDDFGLGSGEACSLGIHESQSRMWENLVGRSRAFWDHFYPKAQAHFPAALSNVSQKEFYAVINDLRPSWIRVEADEVTYNLHIMLRFEIEQSLISGELDVEDVPTVWNETFTRYFQMTPPTDTLGCLQDVHWGAGLLGYFPTYSLGNMYASQFYEKAQADLGDLSELFRKGEFQPLREWLRKNIHENGKVDHAPQLVEKVTGKPLSAEPLLRHLRTKFGELYRL
ncbi:carboxypeptidase M32 [Planctomicrobium sp. SH661]|uniref:carboxypeptidase M32 n=1 Tax=Planctomicrobium sp. SH661 TaxID=3448124 RepID=UPI003F5B7947